MAQKRIWFQAKRAIVSGGKKQSTSLKSRHKTRHCIQGSYQSNMRGQWNQGRREGPGWNVPTREPVCEWRSAWVLAPEGALSCRASLRMIVKPVSRCPGPGRIDTCQLNSHLPASLDCSAPCVGIAFPITSTNRGGPKLECMQIVTWPVKAGTGQIFTTMLHEKVMATPYNIRFL